MGSDTKTKYNTFWEFYPFYLSQHANATNKKFHCLATICFIIINIVNILRSFTVSVPYYHWLAAPIAGYGFAWIGHFFFENNIPATFKHPIYSIMGDFVMMTDILRGRIKV